MSERKKSLKELFSEIKVALSEEQKRIAVGGIQYDSRKVTAGDLFVAVRGFKTDGHQYLEKAVRSGAAAAVVEEKRSGLGIPQIVVPDSRKILAALAANFYRPEIDRLTLVGITGTNGKTTTSYLVQSILNEAGLPSGLIGTIQYQIGEKRWDAWNTTPESVDICRMLYELHEQKYRACVLEVSSHALALNRVNGLKFKVGAFTNLTRDHLDFHQTLDSYFESKMELFKLLDLNGSAVINFDDPFGQKAVDRISQPVLTFGFSKEADIHPASSNVSMDGIVLECETPFGKIKIESQLTGQFNIQNIQTAIGVGLALAIPLNTIKKGIEAVKRVPGRLESYEIKPGIKAVIDYAHTPDSLEKALLALKKLTPNRLIVVFGAGGDRDRGKRPLMGAVAEKIADLAFVTSDNPRTEDPEKIVEDILTGMRDETKRRVIVDRKQAIFEAVKEARPGDVLLIAGKGHEMYQDINGHKYDFDEAAILKEAARSV
ncbi:MAG: UDP-N-acetylmuramoyl-L-alanyl-D-glutamate--2,6-diaminopimelate ligase [Calditrichaeota bacterium]|nr:UDP-N-acetylmuramoyl-L-alanyl-D-glutamate--2,6-diaminopimelate ligase [Calditrichota bacterium]